MEYRSPKGEDMPRKPLTLTVGGTLSSLGVGWGLTHPRRASRRRGRGLGQRPKVLGVVQPEGRFAPQPKGGGVLFLVGGKGTKTSPLREEKGPL